MTEDPGAIDAAIEDLTRQILSIEAQLNASTDQLHETGIRADAKWFRRAQYAIRAKKAERLKLERKAAALRVAQKKEQHTKHQLEDKLSYMQKHHREATFERLFVTIARSVLDEHLFEEIAFAVHEYLPDQSDPQERP